MARNTTMVTMKDVLHGKPVEQIVGRRFGVEVEAERFSVDEFARLRDGVPFESDALRNLAGTWRVTQDGSLRHNGVEFVSGVLRPEVVPEALSGLWRVFSDGLVRTSVRAGIHIHVNSAHLTPEDYVAQLQNYVLLEPLLFQVAGETRAQNIYCVPWYLTNDEMVRVRAVCEAALARKSLPLRGALDRTCKYSALYIGPTMTFGTVEFRHAPTWPRVRDVQRWYKLVSAVVDTRLDLTDESSVRTLPELLRGFDLDWERYFAEVESRGLYSRARSLMPCTYKARPWGRPAGLAFPASAQAAAAAPPPPSPVMPAAEALEAYRRNRDRVSITNRPVRRAAPPPVIQFEERANALDFDSILREFEARQAAIRAQETPEEG